MPRPAPVVRTIRAALAGLAALVAAAATTFVVAIAVRGPHGGMRSFVHHGAGGPIVAFGLAGVFVVTDAVLLRNFVARVSVRRIGWSHALGAVALVCVALIVGNRIIGPNAVHDIAWLVFSGALLALGPGAIAAWLGGRGRLLELPSMQGVRRVNVVGTSGAGKSTTARAAAVRLGVPVVELDALHWQLGWREATDEQFRTGLDAAIIGDSWVVDGNYESRSRPIVWPRVQVVAWLDLPFLQVLGRVIVRTARRIVRREELWNGNRERLRVAFSRDSIVWWMLSTFHRRRREYSALRTAPEWQHVTILRLRAQRDVDAWLTTLDHEQEAHQ